MFFVLFNCFFNLFITLLLMSCGGHFLSLSKCDDACSIIVCDVVTKERKIVRERMVIIKKLKNVFINMKASQYTNKCLKTFYIYPPRNTSLTRIIFFKIRIFYLRVKGVSQRGLKTFTAEYFNCF